MSSAGLGRALAGLALVLLAPGLCPGQAPSEATAKPRLDWKRSYPLVIEEAQEQRRPLIVYFRDGDCGAVALPAQRDSLGRAVHTSALNDCDRMEDEVWSRDDVKAEAGRFSLLIATDAIDALRRRFLVAKLPTVLFADPWGNEILRVVGYVEPARFLPILKAMPRDLAPLARWGEPLARNPEDVVALRGAAQFYQGIGLGIVTERYYERAAATAVAKQDPALRRDLAVARGVNLMKLARPGDALKLLKEELAQAPEGPGSELLHLAALIAQLQEGKKDEARKSYDTLRAKYPDSAATAKAGEHMKAAQ